MIVLIITNIILVVVIGMVVILELVETVKDKRPIIIKEARALRNYYEERLTDAKKEAEEARRNYANYKELYKHELERYEELDGRRRETDSIASRNNELNLRVIELEGELSSCEGRIEAMAQENDELKKKIKALSKPAKKGKK